MSTPLSLSALLFATVGPQTIVIMLLIGILLFGNKLPEMGRVLARTIREFKKTMGGIEDEVWDAVSNTHTPALPQRVTLPNTSSSERNGSLQPPSEPHKADGAGG